MKQESVQGRGEGHKVGAFLKPKSTNPRTKKKRSPEATSLNPEITKEPKTKTKRGQ